MNGANNAANNKARRWANKRNWNGNNSTSSCTDSGLFKNFS